MTASDYDLPEDPDARLEEIEQELDDLRTEKRAWKSLRSDIADAKGLLGDVASEDLTPDETSAKLDHISQQIGMVMHSAGLGRGIMYRRERLREERAKLKTHLEYEGRAE